MNKKLHVIKYIISDFLSAGLVWTLFYIFRKKYIESVKYGFDVPVGFSFQFWIGLLLIPTFWLIMYYTTGYYRNIYRKSRLKELGSTLSITLLGVIIIFFALILDDTIQTYTNYYFSFIVLFGTHFTLTYFPRFFITNRTIHKLRRGIIGFNTLIIGSNKRALQLYEDFRNQPKSSGNKFIGFINIHENGNHRLGKHLTHMGNFSVLKKIIMRNKIEEVIIAIESSEHDEIKKIINKLRETTVIIKVIPNMYDILTGQVNMSTIYGAPLIEISHELMNAWQESVKRVFDVLLSALAIIILIPLYIALAIGVKLSSKGSIFYSHERIGKYGKPFTIYKYRSMFIGSEKDGPALSSKNDNRITAFGLFMRKSRLDEIPQFYNVLIGDMSLVGPRPERLFFIDQIVKKAPHYYHLQKVRPGITSWGQVKYGYAENVDEMIERLQYDIIYIENMSLYVDFKIMIYTIKTVLKGLGK
jgi:exopolysaccharide biosynthesis polyprenyl glycosylphosphotransferase